MAIIKCKMCGGDIVLAEDKTYGTCEYCGSTMTFPKVSDDQRLNLFNRANHFRRQNEFGKAIAAYDKILDLDDTDAEAHWGAVLSRYGIEYVEDPVTHERIPTCHRVQLGSILTDADYLAALKHAPDTASRDIYEAEAKRIADIQKGILAISAQEKPYDVFICYKETDDNGSRTKDSTLAQDIYYQLTNEGYKVFFSRITLEDKLGREYEPYIFAALNSAKVMLVIGTKPEHFNAVWVKNEWSRYLDLMKRDRNKLLIPCYRDMDPYDLPEELSALQSQDMSKIGFMQDIIRGVKKVLQKDEPKAKMVVQATAAAPTNNAAPLLRRAFMFLEDGDWASANEYAERVLDAEPENGRAYLVKLMVDLKVRREYDLKDQPQPFDGNNNYQKVIRFGDEELKAQAKEYIDYINGRNERSRQADIFVEAVGMLQNAQSVDQCQVVKAKLNTIPTFEGVKAQLAACDQKIENINESHYRQAQMLQKAKKWQEAIAAFTALRDYRDSKSNIAECEESIRADAYQKAEDLLFAEKWENAIHAFEKLGDYRDSQQKIQRCKDAKEAEQQAAEERREQQRLAAEAKAKAETVKKRTVTAIVAAFIVLVIAAGILYVKVIKPNGIYSTALKALDAGKYDDAISAFSSLGEYKDAATRVNQAQADQLFANGSYSEALTVYNALDAAYRTHAADYEQMYTDAERMLTDGDYDSATAVFQSISGYNDAATQALESRYQKGVALLASGDYDGATTAFESVSGYNDADTQAQESQYQKGVALLGSKDFDGATAAFQSISGYNDADTQALESQYQKANNLNNEGRYDEAYAVYAVLTGYKDVDSIIKNDDNFAAAAAAWRAQFSVGNAVKWGHYEQDGNTSNGAEVIEWLVLANDGDTATLISKYGLDAKPYNKEGVSITWETCTLRKWLNGDFLNTAFTEEECAKLATVTVTADKNPNYDTDPGNDTLDRVFLLSIDEVNRFFISDDARVCMLTKTAVANGAYTSNFGSCWWWLRSPGSLTNSAADVYYDGSVSCSGNFVYSGNGVVRPVVIFRLS